MINSMTGFGKGRAKSEYGNVIVEIKTINHRYFELSARIPPYLSLLEFNIRELLKKELKRGRVNFFLELEKDACARGHIVVNDTLAEKYQKKIKTLSKKLKIENNAGVLDILQLPGVSELQHTPISVDKVLPALTKAVTQALNGIMRTRKKEGRMLAIDVSKRVKNIFQILKIIQKRAPIVVKGYKERLLTTSKKFQNTTSSDKERLEKDIALFAKGCDISEEICRIEAHVKSFSETLKKGGEIGKKLDFIAQELHRETTTIGSKANDFKISSQVIKIKSEIEKIREQLQNIE